MKGQTEAIKIGLEVLTPVHVGSGEELQLNLDYIDRNGTPFVVDQNRTFEVIAAGNAALDTLLQSTNLNDLISVAGVQHGYTLPTLTGRGYGKAPSTIRACLKDAMFRPYIAGSSIKGAIRTALMAEWLRQQPADSYRQELPRNSQTKAKFAANRLTKTLFGENPNCDLLRALHVGDANFQTTDLRLADIRWLNIVQQHGKEKAHWRNMGNRRSVPQWKEANGLYAEVLTTKGVAVAVLQWDRFLLSDLTRWGAPSYGKELLPANFTELCQILNRHARYILEGEISFFEHYKVGEPAKRCRELLQQLAQDSESGYLRLAWGSGWKGMTGDWLDEESLSKMREYYRLGKRDGQFPKTRRLAVQGSPCLPLGWVRLSPATSIDDLTASPLVLQSRHPWVDEQISAIQHKNRCQPDEALRGTQLAQAWQTLDDPVLKRTVLEDIRARWQERNWWDNPTGKSAKKARKIYQDEP